MNTQKRWDAARAASRRTRKVGEFKMLGPVGELPTPTRPSSFGQHTIGRLGERMELSAHLKCGHIECSCKPERDECGHLSPCLFCKADDESKPLTDFTGELDWHQAKAAMVNGKVVEANADMAGDLWRFKSSVDGYMWVALKRADGWSKFERSDIRLEQISKSSSIGEARYTAVVT